MGINKKSKLEAVINHYRDYTPIYLEVVKSAIQSHRSVNEEVMLNYYFETMKIRSGQKLLDLGCGVCGPAIHFAKKADIYIDAVNISETQIEIANPFAKVEYPAFLEEVLKNAGPEFTVAIGLAIRKLQEI